MADIDITCPKCSKVTTVSEFVDDTNLICRACNERLKKPGPGAAPAAQKKPTGLKLKPRDEKPVAQPASEPVILPGFEEAGEPVDPDANRWQAVKEAEQAAPKAKKKLSHHVAAWIVFIVLAAIAYYWRYGRTPSKKELEVLTQFGPLVVVGIHVVVLLKAYRDSVFQGILCTLVPFYSFYYLFGVSDDFFMRGIFAAILIAIGQTSAEVFNELFFSLCDTVHNWIASGG